MNFTIYMFFLYDKGLLKDFSFLVLPILIPTVGTKDTLGIGFDFIDDFEADF